MRGKNCKSERERRARRSQSKARYRNSHRQQIRDAQNEKNFRWRSRNHKPGTVNSRELRRPSLYYIDTNGVIHHEEELSAEELIRRWQEKENEGAKTK